MSDDNQNNDDQNNDNQKPDDKKPTVEELVAAQVAEALKPIKGNLDNAFAARDEALRQVEEFKAKERERELRELEEQGKHKEVAEARVAEEKARREAAEKRVVELTRDIDVRNALSAYPFRNENASEMAYRELVGQLVQDANGLWVHKSGVAVKEAVKAFAELDSNSFLFTPKASSGSGSSGTGSPQGTPVQKKSLFDMTQAEVLQLAREGKLQT